MIFDFQRPIGIPVSPRSLDLQMQRPTRLSLRIETEIFELLGPVRVGITQALDIDAAREASFNCCRNQLRGKKRERERQIDLALGASLSFRKLLNVND